ncbi:DNA polymerase IV [Candidatus Berkelbacteria bacterium]|nr:DNA polymerase IV [Candidatus Berkelbacteria bacterium]
MAERWILHVDMNSYFASVEQQVNPQLRGKPVGVGGKPGTRSVIAAASREAKARGVKTAMSSWEAVRICPELILVPPRYDLYQEYSERLFGLVETISPLVEIFSIDEAFVELASNRRPPNQSEVEWITGTTTEIKRLIRSYLGDWLTASIGVARNKRLAKLASETMKPDGLVVLLGDDELALVEQFRSTGIRAWTRAALYATTDVETLSGIGPRLGRRLRGVGIQTLADLATKSLDELRTVVYPYERELYLVGQGIDPSPVVPYWKAKPEQSIGHQYTLPTDLPVLELPPAIAWLAERVGRRLRRGAFVAHSLHLYLRQTNAPGWGSHVQTTRHLETDQDIYHAAWELIRTAADRPDSGLAWATPVRMPALTVTKLVRRVDATQSLLPEEQRNLAVATAIDHVKDRFGSRTITSGLSVDVAYHNIPDGRRKRFAPTNFQGSISNFQ